ncbi:hypothetical protein PBY51_001001 [Eleginops maclovinus]|uniref:Uncharacterized protein n=1 Tax=Eleginops maclovinus TaxID=56733 RepID=A0AAN7XNL8_ELEMC|nr:hypothetical protein PBY51_001001 [Eleginops maclovinus]
MLCAEAHLHCHTCAASSVPAGEAPFCSPRKQPAERIKTARHNPRTGGNGIDALFKETKPPLPKQPPTPSSPLFSRHM